MERVRKRFNLPVTAAIVFAVIGVVLLTVGFLSSRPGPPQPSAAAAGVSTSFSAAGTTAGTTTSSSTSATSTTTKKTAGQPTAPKTTPAKPSTRTTTAAATTKVTPEQPAVQGPILANSAPVSLSIPKIGVSSALLDLGLNSDGTVQVPSLDDPNSQAGWYEKSPTPGALGPAIILGHIDSRQYGPGVFYNLGKLLPGDTVSVTRKDGVVAVFRVDSVKSYPKNNFPTFEVYGNLDHAGLRLITCGGVFDPSKSSYESNIVAFASLVSSHR